MPKRSCECVKQNSYNVRAVCKPCMSPQFPAVATKYILTKHGEFCLLKKDLFSCYIKQIMNVFFHSCNGTNIFIR